MALHHSKHRVHHRHHAFPGLNSPFIEALIEEPDLSGADIEKLVCTYAPQLNDTLHAIVQEGFSESGVIATLLQLEEAKNMLQSRADLVRLCAKKQAAIVLPIPPHIFDGLESVLNDELVFKTDHRHLPPHLRSLDALPLERLLQNDFYRLANVTAVALEAFFDNGELLLHYETARFVERLSVSKKNLMLFAHFIPHLPHEHFVSFDGDSADSSIDVLPI